MKSEREANERERRSMISRLEGRKKGRSAVLMEAVGGKEKEGSV